MVCGYQDLTTQNNANPIKRQQASSPRDVADAIELNLIENGAQAFLNTAAAVVALSATLAF